MNSVYKYTWTGKTRIPESYTKSESEFVKLKEKRFIMSSKTFGIDYSTKGEKECVSSLTHQRDNIGDTRGTGLGVDPQVYRHT